MTNQDSTAFPLDVRLAKLDRHLRATPELSEWVFGIYPRAAIFGSGLKVQIVGGLPALAAWAASMGTVIWRTFGISDGTKDADGADRREWAVHVAGSVWHVPVEVWTALPLSTGVDAESVSRVCAAYTAEFLAAAPVSVDSAQVPAAEAVSA